MSYLMNQPVVYTAVGSTPGTSDTFTYLWKFDDAGTGNTNTLNHTWITSGAHTASVTATDLQTGGTASEQKTVNVIDGTVFAWTNSGVGNINSFLNSRARFPVVVGNDFIYTGDYYTGTAIYRYSYPNTWVQVATRSGTGVGSYGTSSTLLNDGRILMVGGYYDSKAYGFFNTSTNVYTHSPNTSLYGKGTGADGRVKLSDGRVLFTSTSGDSIGPLCEIYNPISDTWAATGTRLYSPTSSGNGMFLLPSGDVILLVNNTTTTEVWNHNTGTWSDGPSLPGSFASSGSRCGVQGIDGIIYYQYGLQMYIYQEGAGTFVAVGGVVPGTSLHFSYIALSDGKIMCTGGSLTSVNTTPVYYPSGATWATIPKEMPILNEGCSVQLANGVIIANDGSGGTGKIFYSTPWI